MARIALWPDGVKLFLSCIVALVYCFFGVISGLRHGTLSEDFQNGRELEGVIFINPFELVDPVRVLFANP